MKKILIGSLVGAILLFGWQAISWTASGVHDKAYQYLPNQDSIINFLSAQLPGEGQYMVPRSDPKSKQEEQMRSNEQMKGRSWAVISYHKAYEFDMVKPMLRGFVISFICVWLACLMIRRFDPAYKNFLSVFTAVLTFGAICFLFVWYNQHNWFQTTWDVLWGELIDNLVAWGLCGIWLGWWYSRKERRARYQV